MKIKRTYFKKDIKYDIPYSPVGTDFRNMSPKQAKTYFEWFTSIINDRIEYMNKKYAEEMRIQSFKLDYSSDSLVLLWQWFLRISRLEKTSKEELKVMQEGAKIFGESFINYEQFTVTTKMIMQDIGMYLGECYVKKYNNLFWCYKTKPKNGIDTNRPIIGGFYVKHESAEEIAHFKSTGGEAFYNPVEAVEGCAANIFYNTENEFDLYYAFQSWEKFIPR